MSSLRRRGRRKARPSGSFQSINITPFTDVLLVLLIIFLIAGSSLVGSGLPVDSLSKESAKTTALDKGAVKIVVAQDGKLRITRDNANFSLTELLEFDRSTSVSLSAEERTSVDKVIYLYDQLLNEGFQQVQLSPPISDSTS